MTGVYVQCALKFSIIGGKKKMKRQNKSLFTVLSHYALCYFDFLLVELFGFVLPGSDTSRSVKM